jgi:hypothetical protein
MASPSSGRGVDFFAVVFLAVAVFVLIQSLFVAGGRGNKKPTTVASRGFLSKFASSATNPAGVAVGYDDDDRTNINLQRIHLHCG